MAFEPIDHLESWIVEQSQGWPVIERIENRIPSTAQRHYIERYQLDGFATDISRHRVGKEPTAELLGLIEVIGRSKDADGLMVYRGLSLNSPLAVNALHAELSISSWSLYPSIALRAAFARGNSGFCILRDRVSIGEPSLYIDEYEFEVLRLPQRWCVSNRTGGNVDFMKHLVYVDVVDLERVQ